MAGLPIALKIEVRSSSRARNREPGVQLLRNRHHGFAGCGQPREPIHSCTPRGVVRVNRRRQPLQGLGRLPWAWPNLTSAVPPQRGQWPGCIAIAASRHAMLAQARTLPRNGNQVEAGFAAVQ